MKNLKRILSLALASTMLVGMMVVGASAATFTDTEGNDHETAIEIMTGLGILKGKGDGKFDPNGSVARGEMAKMIAVCLVGKEFNYGTKTVPTFSDIKGHWAENYIEYCYNYGYINGRGDGTFDPNGQVTSTEAARMILNVLGIKDGATGGNWALNTEVDANNIGLYAGLAEEITDPTRVAMTRDQAAQMLFNGINYSKDGETTTYVVTDKDGKTVLYKGTDALTALIMKQGNADSTLKLDTVNTGSIANKVFGLTRGTETDDFGRTYTTYTNGDKVTYASFAPKATKTYTTATTLGKIAGDLGATKATGVKLTVITDGAKGTETEYKKDNTDTIGGAGTLIEVYKTGSKAYDVVVVNTYVKELDKNDIVKADKENDIKAHIVLESGLTYETTAFAKGDVVLYTKGSADGTATDKISNVVKADYITGSVSAHGAGYFRVDGEKMVLSKNAHDANGNAITIGTTEGYKYDANDAAEYTYFLDSYGNVIYAKAGTIAVAEDKFIFVIAKAAKAAKGGETDLFETTAGSAAVAQAKVVDLATGEVSVKSIAVVKGTDNKYYYANANGSASNTEVTDLTATTTEKIMTYTELEDGSIVLGSEPTTQDVKLTTGKADINVNGKYANASTKVTILTYKSGKASGVTTYTGIANFPKMSAAKPAVVISNGSLVTGIIIVAEPVTPTATVNYAIYAGEGETSADGTAHAFYVGGKLVSYYLGKNVTIGSIKAGDVVDLKLSDGKIAETPTALTTGSTAIVAAAEDTFFVVSDATPVYYAKDCTIVDKDADYTVTELTKGDSIKYWVNGDGEATFIIVNP